MRIYVKPHPIKMALCIMWLPFFYTKVSLLQKIYTNHISYLNLGKVFIFLFQSSLPHYIILKHIATTYLSKRPPGTSTSHKLFQMPIHHSIPFPNLQTKEEKTKSIDWRCKLADLIDYWPAPGTIPQWMYNISIAAGLGRIFGGIRGHWYLIKPTFEIPIRIKIALNTKSKMGL